MNLGPRPLLAAAVVAVAASIVTVSAIAQQPPTFKSGTQVVSLFVTVADAQKRLVPDLTKDDFEVFDNDKPQPLGFFANEVQPITGVVKVGTSGGMAGSIAVVRPGAEGLPIRLLADAKGRGGAFN